MPLSGQEHRHLVDVSHKIRQRIIDIVYQAGSGHVGGSLSQVEILVSLYFHAMQFDPKQPRSEDRDRFVLSKGHGGLGLCAVFAELEMLTDQELARFGETGFYLGMHMDHTKVAGIEASTGSLGHGFGVSVGMALGARVQKFPWWTYCLISDGECYEGSIWEAAMAAAGFGLNKLTLFIDRNRLTMDGFTEEEMPLDPLGDKYKAFGWKVWDVDGHDVRALVQAIEGAKQEEDKPSVIIANTIKGKGVDFMEEQAKWHYGALDSEMYEKAKASIQAQYDAQLAALQEASS